MKRSAAEIIREYGPFPGADRVNGVTFDGQRVWFAAGDTLNAFDPESGNVLRSIDLAAHATSSCWRRSSKRNMRRCSRFSPTASRGRAPPWQLRLERARAPCSGRSIHLRSQARCSRSVAGERVVG